MRKIGFKGGTVDPCLLTNKSKLGVCFAALYVDDNLIVGHPKSVEDNIKQTRKHGLVLKVEDNARDYLSCNIVLLYDHLRVWIGQPHLIAKLEIVFDKEVKTLCKTQTPGMTGTPGQNQVQ